MAANEWDSGPLPAIAVVIPAYNGGDCLNRCLEAVLRTTPDTTEIVIVDNGSTDSTPAIACHFAATWERRVHVIGNESNKGFPAACNQGIRWALSRGEDYIVLLNQDAFPEPGWLEALTCAAVRHPDYGAIQALVLLDASAPNPTINTAGNPLHFLGFSWCGACGQPVPTAAHSLIEVPVASGAALLLTRRAIEAAGLFDEGYFLYHEDVDLCWRIRLSGFRVGVAMDAHVYHRYTGHIAASKFCFSECNRWRLLWKTASGRRLVLIAPLLCASALASLAVAVRRGWLVTYLRSMGELLADHRSIAAERRRIQCARLIRESDLAQWLSAEIEAGGLLSPATQRWVNGILRLYWRVISRLL